MRRREGIPDPLHEAIEKAIQQPLDGKLFERCAVDLLRDNYYPDLPGLRMGTMLLSTASRARTRARVHPGGDDGEGLRTESEGSIRSHLHAGGPGRRFVFATTREITGKQGIELREKLHEEFGIQLHAVYDRGDFVRMLYDHPQWRKDLLGVAGAAKALSRFPPTRGPRLRSP